MASRICSVDGCDREAFRREWCCRHYQKWLRYGDPSRPNMSRTTDERFWEKVDKMGPTPGHVPGIGRCWVWTASCNGVGYGQIWFNSRRVDAHRASWELANGPIPDGLWVLHHCDNRKCVNPDHLFLGTVKDNMVDMHSKGRANPPRGEAHQGSRLTEQDVIYIRRRYAQGDTTFKRLGAEFHVTGGAIGGIIRGLNWKSVSDVQAGG